MDVHHNQNQRIRGTNPQVEQAARDLRKNLTPAEEYLWQALKKIAEVAAARIAP